MKTNEISSQTASHKSHALQVLLWTLTAIASIGSGLLAWKWMEPVSGFGGFGGFGFLMVWLVLTKVGHYFAEGFVKVLDRKMNHAK